MPDSRVALEPTLKSIYAGQHRLHEFKTDKTKALVLAFLDTECPIARKYIPRLKEIHERLKDKGVRVLGIYANTRVNIWSMAAHAHDSDIPFPVLLDLEQRLADRLGVQVTPEVVVLDAELNKQYQGPIDNQFKLRGKLQQPTENYLEDALAALLKGQPVQVSHVPAAGCPLGRQEPLLADRQVTFHRDIAPILQKNCQSCHRTGGVGPFKLLSYEDAYYNAERIAEVVGDRRMPPWHGELNPHFGELRNDKRLSDSDIKLLLGWVEQGAPQGDTKDAPPPVQWPSADAWEIGRPDFVYKMPQPFRVPKDGVLEYQFFRAKLNLPADRWYRAVEVKPGNAQVVHHVAIHVVPAGDKRYQGLTAMAELYGFNTQRGNVICDYVPGDTHNATIFDANQAGRIPKNCDLIYEVHYTPNNRQATTDQSMVAFKWADQPPQDEVQSRVFRKPVGRFRIPPHDPHYRMEDSYYCETDIDLDAVRPHFHLRAKSYRLEIVDRDEDSGEIVKRETLLTVPLYDQNWQRTYELKKPLRLKAGTELLATAHFDNSSLNPNNPDPSREVLWGQQTTDEMFSTRFRYRVVKADRK
jgi:hypothetical protein